MTEQEDSTLRFELKIPSSLSEKRGDRDKETPKETLDYNFFRKTNIVPIQVTRNSELGTTHVQSLDFIEPDQRLKVLESLDAPGLYDKLSGLLDCIYQFGGESDYEKRYFAGVAISELAIKKPFLDLKEAVILPWAKNEDPRMHDSAAVALSQLLKRAKPEVLALLNHWISLKNPSLMDSALSTYFLIADTQPADTLEAIGAILKSGAISYYQSVTNLLGAVYDSFPSLTIEKLHSWLLPVTETDLCWMAGMLSLNWIELDDAAEDERTRKKVAEIISALWNDPRMPLHDAMQEETTVLVEKWADEAVRKMNRESSPGPTPHRAFFRELYEKCEGGRRNRLDFYLRKWEEARERKRERERLRSSRRGKENSLEAKEGFGYLQLLPQEDRP